MKLRLFKVLIVCLCVTTIPFHNIFTEKKTHFPDYHVIPADQASIKAIIFDVGDVLVTSSRSQHISTLFFMALQNPSCMYTLIRKDIKKELFAMLHKVPAHTNSYDIRMYNHGKQMPQIMVDWQIGRSNVDIYASTLTYLATSDYSVSQKALFSKIIQLIFQPQKLIQALSPIEHMVTLAHHLKKSGYKLYVLSNWDPESFPLLHKKYSTLFDIFDGIMISGTEGIGKPDHRFYTNLLNKYNLTPSECVFIDDEPYNIAAANHLGIHAIVHDSFDTVCIELKNLGIIQLP